MAGDLPPAAVEVSATRLWEREVHGTAGQQPMFDPDGSALYFTDGWGRRPAPALRFRRLDVRDGTEVARWPCGSAIRCLVRLDDGDLLVATDQRLVRLDAETLAEHVRWDRSVKHATTIAVDAEVAVAGNAVTPTITLVSLETGRVRRTRYGPVVEILGRRDENPLLLAASGGLATIDPTTATITRLRTTPGAMAAAMADDAQGVWMIAGNRVQVTELDGGASMRPGSAMTEIQWYPLGEGEPRTVHVPAPARTIDVAAGRLWLTPAALPGTAQYVVIGSTTGEDWRIWHAPPRALVEAIAPNPGLVLATTHHVGASTTVLGCYRIDDPPWPPAGALHDD